MFSFEVEMKKIGLLTLDGIAGYEIVLNEQEAKVALITTDEKLVAVWINQIRDQSVCTPPQ